jgi:cell division protein FtsL
MLEISDKYSGKPITKGTYPNDYRKTGEGDENFKIFISDLVLTDIKAFLSSDKEKELGGVLLGEVYLDDENSKFILLNEFVIALYTEASITRLTFTHSSWEYINNKIDNEYPGKKILGWFHSHPGHTVFLSSYDKFIHENFFTADYNVAYVFDPINNDDGFFFTKDNKLERAGCYYIYSQFQINRDNINSLNQEKGKEKKTKKGNTLTYLVFLLSALVLILSVTMVLKYNDINNKNAEIKELSGRIKELKDENAKINAKLEDLFRDSQTSQDSTKANQNLVKHQIKPGETLRSIALLYLKDEGKYNFLIRHNNLKDENDIAVGQIIEIPLER